jgi:hypothetical protein
MFVLEKWIWNWTVTRKIEMLASERVCCGEMQARLGDLCDKGTLTDWNSQNQMKRDIINYAT